MRRQGGFTLLELVVTATVLMILASVTVPLARNGLKRQQELELRRSLREIRELLVEGVPATGSLSKKIRFLRRIPVDPMTGKAEWGLRNTSDDANSTSWGGGHVYDVYTLSQGTGMNGIPYREW